MEDIPVDECENYVIYRIQVMSEPRTVKIQIQLPEDLRTRFKAKCVTEGVTMNQIVVELIEAWSDSKTPDAVGRRG